MERGPSADMDESKALSQQQLKLIQQQQQQQMYLLQQFQQQQHYQQQRQQQQAAMARFPSNIDAHLRPLGTNHPLNLTQTSNPNPNPNPNPNVHPLHHQSSPRPNPNSSPQALQQLLQQKVNRAPQQQQSPPLAGNQAELQMAYQDAWRICHPDFKRHFSSVEDACERLLPYHVVADYEAEEDDRILDSDTTGQIPSRSQQWDHNIAAKVAEFTATFEKQALAFNIITRKRAMGEFRSEERLMIEQALLQEEKRTIIELRAEIESREKAGREAHEANLRMAAMQAERARVESQAHADLMARAPIRASALGSQASNPSMSHEMTEQEQEANPDEMINGWSNNAQREEREPSEDFLNDEEAEHGDTGMQEGWRESGEFDLNTR